MATFRTSGIAFSASLIALMAVAGAARAQDANAVAERLKATLAVQGITFAYTGVSGDASSMVLDGVSVKPATEQTPLPIGKVTLEGVTDANGGYKVATLSTEAFNKNAEGVTLDISPIVLHGMSIPAEGSTDPLASFMFYESGDIASVSAKMGDTQLFTMEGAHVAMTPPASGSAMSFTADIPKINADLTSIPDPQTKAVLDGLGYQQLSGNIKMTGSWNPADGKVALTQYDLAVDNAGTLGMTVDLSGYTTDFIKSMQDLQKQMAAQPQGADNSAQGMAMLGLMQQLTLNSAAIKFTDASLTNKVLDYVGKMQGQSGKDIANMAKAMVPFGMAQLNNPELTTQVSAAVSAFLDNPKSLTIAAKPAQPQPFAVLAASGMGDPTALPKVLGLTVTAND